MPNIVVWLLYFTCMLNLSVLQNSLTYFVLRWHYRLFGWFHILSYSFSYNYMETRLVRRVCMLYSMLLCIVYCMLSVKPLFNTRRILFMQLVSQHEVVVQQWSATLFIIQGKWKKRCPSYSNFPRTYWLIKRRRVPCKFLQFYLSQSHDYNAF